MLVILLVALLMKMTTSIVQEQRAGSWDDFSSDTNYIQVSAGQDHIYSYLIAVL